MVVLRKLRDFQDLGHTAVLVVGDYTARVGDPSGRTKTRPVLSPEEIEANTGTYLEQAYLVLDRERTEVRRNSEWLAGLTLADLIELTRATTVARILERDDFSKRFSAGEQITLTELLYPLMQAYDSVALDADVELGGTDQLYNLLMGRHVMEYYGKSPQCVLTTPLLVGTDGERKMSKSLGNYIGVTDPPKEMFGKAMSIPDHLMPEYYSLVLDSPMPEAAPVEQKRELARSLVGAFHATRRWSRRPRRPSTSSRGARCRTTFPRLSSSGGWRGLDRGPHHAGRLRQDQRRGEAVYPRAARCGSTGSPSRTRSCHCSVRTSWARCSRSASDATPGSSRETKEPPVRRNLRRAA